MAIFVVWDEPHKQLLHFVYRPYWTEHHFEAAVRKATTLLDNIDHRVHLVIDHQQVRFQPKVFLFQSQRLIPITQHRNTGHVIVLGVPSQYDALRSISIQGDRPFRNYFFTPTLDAIYEQLQIQAGV